MTAEDHHTHYLEFVVEDSVLESDELRKLKVNQTNERQTTLQPIYASNTSQSFL